jgi:hypothetical protein
MHFAPIYDLALPGRRPKIELFASKPRDQAIFDYRQNIRAHIYGVAARRSIISLVCLKGDCRRNYAPAGYEYGASPWALPHRPCSHHDPAILLSSWTRELDLAM